MYLCVSGIDFASVYTIFRLVFRNILKYGIHGINYSSRHILDIFILIQLVYNEISCYEIPIVLKQIQLNFTRNLTHLLSSINRVNTKTSDTSCFNYH